LEGIAAVVVVDGREQSDSGCWVYGITSDGGRGKGDGWGKNHSLGVLEELFGNSCGYSDRSFLWAKS